MPQPASPSGSSSRLAALLNANLETGVLTLDSRGTVEHASPRACDILGIEADTASGRQWADIVGPETADDLTAITPAVMHLKRDGRLVSLEMLPGGEEGGWVVLARIPDTEEAASCNRELAARNRELQEVNKRLKDTDQMKSAFLSQVSHELRSPLTSLRGFVKLIHRDFSRLFAPLALDDTRLIKKAKQIQVNLEIVFGESERLTRLLNNLLDLSKIEAGRMEWRDIPLKPEQLVEQSVASVQGLFSQIDTVRLKVEVGAHLPVVKADPDKLQQLLINLLTNAAKHTASGAVTLWARQHDPLTLEFGVRDTGVGIAAEHQRRIFEKFRQISENEPGEGKSRGTGLGLAICKEIAEHYGGRIWVESAPGRGSDFIVRLPAAAANAPAEGVATGPETGALVLVVDDDPSICAYLGQLLNRNGYRTVTAFNGERALELAREYMPDCITMDILMPGADGRYVINTLRTDPTLLHIPVLVISAMPAGDQAGGDAAILKPVDEDQMLDSIRKLMRRNRYTETILAVRGDETDRMNDFISQYSGELELVDEPELVDRLEKGFDGIVLASDELARRLPESVCGSAQVRALPSRSGRNRSR